MAQNELTHRGYSGSIEVSIEDDCLHGRIQFIDDLITYEGETVALLRAEFEAAVDRYLEHCAHIGKEPNKPYSGSFNVRIGADLHCQAAKISFQKGIKLNVFVKEAIQAAVDRSAVITHEHHHQHNVNVVFDSGKEMMTVFAGMQEPAWESASGKPH